MTDEKAETHVIISQGEIQKWKEQLKKVEDEMDRECKKIIAEMKYAKEKVEKEHEEKLKKINDEANDKIKKEVTEQEKVQEIKKGKIEQEEKENTERLQKLSHKEKKLTEEAKIIKTEAHDVKEILEKLKLLTENDKREILKQAAEKDIIRKIKRKAQNFRKRRWEEYYMKIACLAALRSKDPSTPVGACIVDTESYQIVGIGYNSMPYVKGPEKNDEIFPWEGSKRIDKKYEKLKYLYVVHAAVNAVLNKTRESIKGCTIYLTHFPDKDCVHAIIEAKITEVVYCMFTRRDKREEEDDMKLAKNILTKNSVIITKIDNQEIIEEKLTQRIVLSKEMHDQGKWPKGPATDFITWEEFFMEIALLSKERSTHKTKVGACVVSPKKQVLAVGYNAYPEDMIHDETEDEESDYISHAEYKAIVGISPSVQGCTLYVTQYPCYMCAKVIVQSGITKVVYDEEGSMKNQRYIGSKNILTKCLEPLEDKKIRLTINH